MREVAVEVPFAIVVVRRNVTRRVRVRHAPECKLRVPPLEFPVVQLGVQVDVFARVFRHVQAVVHCIRGAGRYQPNINNGAARPRIALVDGIAVRINL